MKRVFWLSGFFLPAGQSSLLFLPLHLLSSPFLLLTHFLHLFFLSLPPSLMTQINEEQEKMKKDLKLLDTHTHTSVVSIFSAALSATFPSPGHSVPRDAGKAPGGAKLT